MDDKQVSIVYQNQSHLAFAILKHNVGESTIDPKAVIELTLKLTRVALNAGNHLRDQDAKSK